MERKSKQLTKIEYYKAICNFAKRFNKGLLLSLLEEVLIGDKYYCTWKGIERILCKLSLEYLIRKYIRPGGYWHHAHSLFCQSLEWTNPYMAYLYLEGIGYWKNRKDEESKVLQEFHRIGLEGDNLTRMFLMYRGFFKTSIGTVGFSVQEFLINKNLRKLLLSGDLKVVQGMNIKIKSNFMYNEKFRILFNDYCPAASKTGKMEFGTQDDFTLPNRTRTDIIEPSIYAASVESRLTGSHFDKHCPDDLIDNKNVTTPEQLEKAKNLFELAQNLYDNNTKPFYDMFGTHYHSLDLYIDLKTRCANANGEYEYQIFNPKTQNWETRLRKIA